MVGWSSDSDSVSKQLANYTSSRHGVTLTLIQSRVSGHLVHESTIHSLLSLKVFTKKKQLATKCCPILLCLLFGAKRVVHGGLTRAFLFLLLLEVMRELQVIKTKEMSWKMLKHSAEKAIFYRFVTTSDPFPMVICIYF